jgi:DNA helicase-2/ATP-dependent DNA helicase PcrA
MTRARDWLSLSRHDRVNKKAAIPSPFWREHVDLCVDPGRVTPPRIESGAAKSADPITITYSDLARFLACPQAYRFRSLVGFQPRLAPELGYGKAVHHVLRTIAQAVRSTGSVPSDTEIDGILDASFFLPTASKPAHRQLKEAARRLITEYASSHADDLFRTWETERPFELHLEDVTVAGRADVILDNEAGVEAALAILDYKTSASVLAEHELQLQVYADAGRREGLDVRAAYVHDLKAGIRAAVAVDRHAVKSAERTVAAAAVRLRNRDYRPTPGPACRRCEFRSICRAAVP